jgi:hypothetical protein
MVNNDKEEKISNKDIIMNAKVIELNFTYSPMYIGSIYHIVINGNNATLEITTGDNVENRDLNNEEIELIKQSLIEGDVISWDGYYKSDPDVLDGASFSMTLKIDDRTISAHGSNSWPNNYHKFRELFYKVVKQYV